MIQQWKGLRDVTGRVGAPGYTELNWESFLHPSGLSVGSDGYRH